MANKGSLSLTTPTIIKHYWQERQKSKKVEVNMSGAQGTLPPGSTTATTYHSVPGGENQSRMDIHSKEDEGKVQIDKLQDKVEDCAGRGGPIFGDAVSATVEAQEQGRPDKPDPGVTGTG